MTILRLNSIQLWGHRLVLAGVIVYFIGYIQSKTSA
jgi:hypothetical protein